MESENEERPLLVSFAELPRRKRLCRRIPCEVALTGAILGLFLFVVTLLIVFENLKTSSSDLQITSEEALGLSLKHNQKLLSKSSWKDDNSQKRPIQLLKKSKYTSEEPNKDGKGNNEQENLLKKSKFTSEESIESTVSYKKEKMYPSKKYKDPSNKKEKYKNPSTKSEKYKEPSTESEKYRKHYQYSTEIYDNSMEEFDDFSEMTKKSLRIKLDFVKKWIKKWKRNFTEDASETTTPEMNQADKEQHIIESVLDHFEESGEESVLDDLIGLLAKTSAKNTSDINLLGSPFSYNKKAVDRTWQEKKEKYAKTEKDFNKYKWDNVNKGWKEFHDKSVPVPYAQGCPFRSSEPDVLNSELQSQINCAVIAEEMRRDYGKCIDLSFLPRECKPTWSAKCFSTYKYRKIDGTCNNRVHPTWGKSGTPFVRMIAPDYGDGISSLRTSKTGAPLPNARFLSEKLYSKRLKQDIDATLLFVFFGLFIDHDMAETLIEGSLFQCCDQRFDQHPEWRPKECLQIDVSPDDPFYGPKNVKCLDLVRSTPVQGACIGRREQLNKATAFLDGSVVYGSTIEKSKKLRQFSKGQLKTQMINHTPFMIYVESNSYKCGTPSEPLKCFESGDSRVNMIADLAAMHTLWYREHNRIAEELHSMNPQWTDETLYQEARRIVIAEFQNIAYQEFLPDLLGDEAMNYFDLKVDKSNEYNGYDDTIDPGVFNVFAAAAYRFGHSLVQDVLTLVETDNTTKGNIPLHETFFNSQLLHHKGLDLLLLGAASQKIHPVDSFISEEIRDHLFQPSNKDYGHDLAAVGIQRGRDHGLPAYTEWRSVCGLSEIQSWDDLNYVMPPERVEKLREAYQSFEDIDIIPAALAENPVKGSLLGPTYLCIMGRQFRKTRKADRFWYEMQGNIGSFTKDQLKEVYKSNMARIICDNSDNIKEIQKDVFRIPSVKNPFIHCDSIPSVDLSLWKT